MRTIRTIIVNVMVYRTLIDNGDGCPGGGGGGGGVVLTLILGRGVPRECVKMGPMSIPLFPCFHDPSLYQNAEISPKIGEIATH